MSSTEARPVESPRPAGGGPLSARAGARPFARSAPRERAAKAPRRARLVLSRVDPWSVMKLSALLSIALGIVLVVAVAVLWGVLDGMGVFDSVTKTVADVTKNNTDNGTDLSEWLSLKRVLWLAAGVAAVDAILITALATLTAFIYNVSAAVVGGLHLTLTEDG
ncbi:transmembrane protein DUF3566 [Motilibacter peucedani]|uniref:Transmembrane protein DUF3566 n=1 Tax=Motilibacter peucedani TaxID=598650 RepID=A0A420XUE3_9ACTN|nr:DUF3566 domain-containing protein [Motilibacter peucedani]RKS80351.1 transmembrane protein DUF3566 [Motilibacter peucedani]